MADEVDPDPPPPPPEEVVVMTPIVEPEPPVPECPPGEKPPLQGCFAKRTGMEKCFIVVLIIVIIILLAFVGLFIVWYLFSKPPVETCLSEDCVTAGSRLRQYMDDSVEPCNNFFEYACGGYLKKETLNDDENERDLFSEVKVSHHEKIRNILTLPTRANDTDYRRKPRVFYEACMDKDGFLNHIGAEPFKKLTEKVGKIPTLDSTFNESKFDLRDVLVKLAHLGAMPLFDISIERDVGHPSEHRIVLKDAVQELDKSEFKNIAKVDDLETWIRDVLEMLGADSNTTDKDVAAVMDLKIEIAKLKRYDVVKTETPNLDNEQTIGHLDKEYPWINTWTKLFEDFTGHPEMDSGVHIIVTDENFLKGMNTLIGKTPKRVVANYVMYSLLKFTKYLSTEFAERFDQMEKDIYNKDPKSRSVRCVEETIQVFPDFMSRMYVEEYFDKKAKSYLTEMTSDIQNSFLNLLEENPWMSKSTKEQSIAKVKAIQAKIAYPDYILNDKKLNKVYEAISAKKHEYLQTISDWETFKVQHNIAKYRQSKDTTKWEEIYPVAVDHGYIPIDNQIVLTAAFLQDPVFKPGHSHSMIYGSIGSLIGHDLTFAIDEKGREYDNNGKKVNWWNSKDIGTYTAQSQCFVDKYGCHKWNGHSMDGEKTLRENIADNGGLKQAFSAYRSRIKRLGLEEDRLPGVSELDHNKIFFLSYAQMYCSKVKEEYIEQAMNKDKAPSRYRVNGAMANSKDFAEAYQCREESRMNPLSKCTMW